MPPAVALPAPVRHRLLDALALLPAALACGLLWAGTLADWRAAGTLSWTLARELGELRDEPAVVVNLPWMYHDVPLFFNGAASAWRLAHPGHCLAPALYRAYAWSGGHLAEIASLDGGGAP